jgi:hypothetical protein
MAQLEHQARLNFIAMSAGGPNHPSIPLDLAEAVGTGSEAPHLAASSAQIPGGQRYFGERGIWPYFRELVTGDM